LSREISFVINSVKKVLNNFSARQALYLILLNSLSRVFSFLGSAYSARCLGPANLGTSALIQSTSQQLSLTFEGGFSVIGVRKIASDKSQTTNVVELITTFRLTISFLILLIWFFGVEYFIEERARFAWSIGAWGIVSAATNLNYVFQGIQKLPSQNIITIFTSIFTTITYFIFFYPGIFLGADLVVAFVVGIISNIISWIMYFRLFGRFPISFKRFFESIKLLQDSWRYWIISIFASGFDLLQISFISLLISNHDAGIYRAAILLVGAPELLYTSINALLLPKLINWKEKGLDFMWQMQSKLVLYYVIFGLALTICFVSIVPIIIEDLLGKRFQTPILLIIILSFSKLGVFIGQIYLFGLIALGLDKEFQRITVLPVTFAIPILYFFTYFFGFIGTATILFLTQTVSHIMCFSKQKEIVNQSKFNLK
jgi:O-antigen/teichoic acid export membrane protein